MGILLLEYSLSQDFPWVDAKVVQLVSSSGIPRLYCYS